MATDKERTSKTLLACDIWFHENTNQFDLTVRGDAVGLFITSFVSIIERESVFPLFKLYLIFFLKKKKGMDIIH
jgi:hypothetical protein